VDQGVFLGNVVHSFERSDSIRREREKRERAAEERTMEQMLRASRESTLKQRIAAEEEAIVDALDLKKREAQRRELHHRQVAESSSELRELKEKLRAAEVNFERRLQSEEKAMIAERDASVDAATHALAERQRVKAVFQEERAAALARESRGAARVDLEHQMEEKKVAQREARAEFLAEREAVDLVAQKIREEDDAELMRKAQKVRDTQTWVKKFLSLREEAREGEKRRLREEEAAIVRFAEEIGRRELAASQMGAAKREEADRILDRLTKEKERNDRAREEMEDLLDRLYFEEQEEKFELAREMKRAAAVAASASMVAANENQLAIKQTMRLEEQAEEESFRKIMLQRFAEQDRLEQMHTQKRRMKMQEHKREVERLAFVKRAMYEEQMRREMEENNAQAREDEHVAEIVEQERKRLLVDHAARLKDFLPKGVLAKPEDLLLIDSVRLSQSQKFGSTMGNTGRAGTRAAGSAVFEL
jgi:hypothetical protein|tara:strand:- start:4330 stop:5760 length:1431 start_codon:yes stop_codon:yes gene_type:complete